MPDFSYRAANSAGRMVDGRIEASSRDQAMRLLAGKGLTPVELGEATSQSGSAPAPSGVTSQPMARWRSGGAPNFNDIQSLTGELAVMLRAGLPLDRALRVMIGMTRKPSVSDLLGELLKGVKSGKGLSQALLPWQPLFGDFYINMIRSGEAGGQLADVLGRLAEHLERVKALRESVVSALMYPAILVVVAILSVFLMLGFVVPQFETLFADMGEALPLPTRIIVAAGHGVADWGWVILLLTGALVWIVRRWLATPAGRLWRDTRLLGMPVLGKILGKYEVTRFARSMGTLLGNGVPIVTAIRIASDTMENRRLRWAMGNVPSLIKQGGRLTEALENTRLFSPLALNMVRLGEETGRLDSMLLDLARVYDGEVQAALKRALTLLEPLLILVLGAVIAAIIVSILMGILAVNDLAA